MSYNPATGFPRIMPALRYPDVLMAVQWLNHTFGMQEYLRWYDEQGIVRHAEMRLDSGFIEVAQAAPGVQTPKQQGYVSQSLVVLVDDVDAHYQQAKAEGATIITEPEDKPWGLRQYTADDLAGYRWEFSQFLRDVPPAEWGAQLIG